MNHDTSGAEHLLSRSEDLALPMTIRELRYSRIGCPNKFCTKDRGQAVEIINGVIRAPCPTCRGAGDVADPAFHEKLDEVWAVLLFVKRERDNLQLDLNVIQSAIRWRDKGES